MMTVVVSAGGPISEAPGRINDLLGAGRRRLLILAGVSLLVRAVYGIVAEHHYVPISDTDQYFQIAKNIAGGHGFSLIYPQLRLHPTAFRPPLYPTLLGGVFFLVGPSVFVGQVVNVVVGTGVVLMTDVAGRRISGPVVGAVAALVVAFYPPLIANDLVMLSEPLALFLILAVVILLLDARVVLAGVLTGALVLTRPSAQAFVGVGVLWVLWRFGVRRAIAFGLVVVVTVLPWVGRNWAQLGSPVIVTSNGFTLAFVYSPAARESKGFVDPVFDSRFDDTRLAQFNEVGWDQTLRNIAIRSLRQHPEQVLAVVGRNTQRTLELHPSKNDGAEKLDGRRVRLRYVSLPSFYLITVLGVLGLVKHRRLEGAQLLAITAVYFTILNIFTVAPPRLRGPFDLACCLGVGLLVGARFDRRRRSGAEADVVQITPAGGDATVSGCTGRSVGAPPHSGAI